MSAVPVTWFATHDEDQLLWLHDGCAFQVDMSGVPPIISECVLGLVVDEVERITATPRPLWVRQLWEGLRDGRVPFIADQFTRRIEWAVGDRYGVVPFPAVTLTALESPAQLLTKAGA